MVRKGKGRADAAPPDRPTVPVNGPDDANELEPLPGGKGYESLDEGDGPARHVLDEEDLLGVLDTAPKEPPQPAEVAAGVAGVATHTVTLPAGVIPGQPIMTTLPDGREVTFRAPSGASGGALFELQYMPGQPHAASPANGAARAPTGAAQATRKLTEAQVCTDTPRPVITPHPSCVEPSPKSRITTM